MEPAQQPALRLLIVEDDHAFARLLRLRLQRAGARFEIEQVETVRAARAAIERATPDLVLLDLVLPDGRGLDLVQPQEQAEFAVVVLTAHGDESAIVEAMRAGALDYLTKSASVLEHLVPILERTAQRWEEVQARRRLDEAQKQLERQLSQAQKNDALGLLAGGIAHDFNNILTAITGFTNTAMAELEAGSIAEQDLEQVLVAAERARSLVDRVLTFTRQESQERRPESLGAVVREVVGLLPPPLPAALRIEQKLTEHDDQVLTAPVQLHQIVLNLATNACQALGSEGGRLGLETDVVAAAELPADLLGKPAAVERFLRLVVEDDGPGMEPETARQIFHPFFSTRQPGERRGAGLGLAVVKNLVEELGGGLRVTSAFGEGSRFEIFLPRWQPEAAVEEPFEEPFGAPIGEPVQAPAEASDPLTHAAPAAH